MEEIVASKDSSKNQNLRLEGCPINLTASHFDFTDIAMQFLNNGAVDELETFFVTSWAIWYNRNQKVFENACLSPDQVWYSANTIRSNYKEADALCSHSQSYEASKWEAPPTGVYKVNVDGATSGDGRSFVAGVVIRNSKGESIAALCKPLPRQFSSLEIEVLALEHEILLAQEMELSHVILESDALTVVQDIQAKEFNGNFGHLYQGILSLFESFSNWKISHLKREYNKVAHALAQYVKCNGVDQGWKSCSPPMVQHLIQLDYS
ncbi:uncharacterized protein LOC142628944 [Castanea sativa]|uniref:uncharacterized protein LOC142628944 n=1 Tax=Castanea sativa TaxID=21020 RepID=UPI003F64DEB3